MTRKQLKEASVWLTAEGLWTLFACCDAIRHVRERYKEKKVKITRRSYDAFSKYGINSWVANHAPKWIRGWWSRTEFASDERILVLKAWVIFEYQTRERGEGRWR
jgi:hypothetical protein